MEFPVSQIHIVATDYRTYILLYGCIEVYIVDSRHLSGALILVQENVSKENWKKLQEFIFELNIADGDQLYELEDKDSVLGMNRECTEEVKVRPACRKDMVKELVDSREELVRELLMMRAFEEQARVKKAEQEKLKTQLMIRANRDIPVEEISCMIFMFISTSMALYWSHFSFL